MQIDTLVDESDIGRVKVGQTVEFTVDAYPEETFTGTVRLISRSAVTEDNVIYYTVYVDVANPEGKLLPTMTARTNIIIQQQDNTLMVPPNCIYYDGDRRYVKVYDEASKTSHDVDVTVGLTGEDSIAVTGDIKEGDVLLVKQRATQQNNMRGPI